MPLPAPQLRPGPTSLGAVATTPFGWSQAAEERARRPPPPPPPPAWAEPRPGPGPTIADAEVIVLLGCC